MAIAPKTASDEIFQIEKSIVEMEDRSNCIGLAHFNDGGLGSSCDGAMKAL
jgi:hypothetical protein